MEGGVHQAEVDIATLRQRARLHALQRRDDAKGHHHAGHIVDHRQTEPRRRPVRLAGHGEESAFRLHQVVVARPIGPAVVAAISGQMRTDDARIDVLQRGVVEAELCRLIAAQIVHHRIGTRDQIGEDLAALRMLQVEREAALVEVEALVKEAVVIPQKIRPGRAREVAAGVGILNLDDIGAHVGEEHRAIGPGAELLERQDAHPCQRLRGHIGFRSIN